MKQPSINHWRQLYRMLGENHSTRSSQRPQWEQIVSGLQLGSHQFVTVLDMKTSEYVEAEGFHHHLNYSLSTNRLDDVVNYIYRQSLSSRLYEISNFVFPFYGPQFPIDPSESYMFYLPLYDANENRHMYRRRTLSSDVNEYGRSRYLINIFDRLDHVPHSQSLSLYLPERARRHILPQWHDFQSIDQVRLSRRERQVLAGVLTGASSREIATDLLISRHTVDTLRRSVLSKTGAKGTADLVARFAGAGGLS